MGEEDVEAFEKDYELQLFQEEMMWLELEEMLDEEEQESVVYFCEPEQFCVSVRVLVLMLTIACELSSLSSLRSS